ncbi:unnamed protein product [Echinostoma caproni]|uniref:Uncharacterized protein n=1 Tax=Echinostoma caproni TaxID=27848 RepID=A0A3P8L9T7_9TREM|nr:unnamed protein product [Echinostoma caproni]
MLYKIHVYIWGGERERERGLGNLDTHTHTVVVNRLDWSVFRTDHLSSGIFRVLVSDMSFTSPCYQIFRCIDSEQRKSTSRASFKCPACAKTYTDLEVDRLLDPENPGRLICGYCQTEVVEEKDNVSRTDARALIAKFHHQVKCTAFPVYLNMTNFSTNLQFFIGTGFTFLPGIPISTVGCNSYKFSLFHNHTHSFTVITSFSGC